MKLSYTGHRRARRVRPTNIALSIAVFFVATSALAQEPSPPKIDHILLEVGDLKKSIAFYHDFLGLQTKSRERNFAMLQSANVGVFLSTTHWDWDEKRPTSARPGWGMYPHFEVADVAAMMERARKAGYKIAQEPRKYSWGMEAFVADPDGYVWALVSEPK
jgi:catechol 2,3-dioxygenase-like lactoylglutathione lyase family enzyme